MNKKELVKSISDRIDGMTQKDVVAVLEELPEVIKETVASGDKVSLAGFITFTKKHVSAKSGTIQLGDKKGGMWKTPEKDVIGVSLSKSYKEI